MREAEEHGGQTDEDRRRLRRWIMALVALPLLYGLMWFAGDWKDSHQDRCGYTPPGHEHDSAYPAWGSSGWRYEWNVSGLTCIYDTGETLKVGYWP